MLTRAGPSVFNDGVETDLAWSDVAHKDWPFRLRLPPIRFSHHDEVTGYVSSASAGPSVESELCYTMVA